MAFIKKIKQIIIARLNVPVGYPIISSESRENLMIMELLDIGLVNYYLKRLLGSCLL